jgi:hypothetical protein
MRHLELRKNNAYSTVLLVENGCVIGAWDALFGDTLAHYRDDLGVPGAADNWEATVPDETDPEAYGELVEEEGSATISDPVPRQLIPFLWAADSPFRP